MEGLDVTRITRDVEVANPYALNLMRITVDGKPLDDPGKSMPDVQRCTDVALDEGPHPVQVRQPRPQAAAERDGVARFDSLPGRPRHRSDRRSGPVQGLFELPCLHRQRAKCASSTRHKSVRDEPLAVVPVDKDGDAQWRAESGVVLGAGARPQVRAAGVRQATATSMRPRPVAVDPRQRWRTDVAETGRRARVARGLWRKPPRGGEHPAEWRHHQGVRQRHPGRASRVGGRPRRARGQ